MRIIKYYPNTKGIEHHYCQSRGNIPVFVGSPIQRGSGLGQILSLFFQTSTPNSPYRAFLETLLSYDKDVKNEFLAMSLYFPETKVLEAIAPVALADTSNVNPSAVTRFNRTKFGKSFELIGRIHADIFNQARYLMGKCSVKVKLHRHSPKFFLMAATREQ